MPWHLMRLCGLHVETFRGLARSVIDAGCVRVDLVPTLAYHRIPLLRCGDLPLHGDPLHVGVTVAARLAPTVVARRTIQGDDVDKLL